MPSTLDTLKQLFVERRYQAILDLAEQQTITAAADPLQGQAVASALFQLGRYGECLQWCQELSPALANQPQFASLHGAALRRLGQLEAAHQLFQAALDNHPQDPLLRNNFANLLIDQGRFEQAETLLEQLLREQPDYADARANLNRLQLQRSVVAQQQPSLSPPPAVLEDPLLAAFSDEEVKLAGGVSAPSATGPLLAGLPERQLPQEQQELLRLARELVNAAPDDAIQECRNLQRQLGADPAIYAVAGEAYIRLQLFADAEVALLSALALGSQEAAVRLNLANLASMRGDHVLALAWLDQLAAQQPDHPQLAQVRDALFPPGQPRRQGNPFQIVPEQRAPGQFVAR